MQPRIADQFSLPIKSTQQLAKGYHRLISMLAIIVFLVFVLLEATDWLGLRFNISRSIDPGFYWVVEKFPATGDLVSFCPEQNALTQLAYQRGYLDFGNCPGHYERLLKMIVARSGDTVQISNHGVVINGKLLPYSIPQSHDGLGRPLAPFSQQSIAIGQDEFWVMTTRSPLSFDSRYFGPIRSTQVSDVVKPLWTWK